MIPVREFLSNLEYPLEFLAGTKGLEHVCRDVVLLSNEKVWLQKTQDSEYKDTLVFIQANLFPAYTSTLDLLLRFLKQAGAAAILFQGGKKSDFSKATLMLADGLDLPLVWVDSAARYSSVTKRFYTYFAQRIQHTNEQIRRARRRLETSFHETFTLSSWLNTVEQELYATARLCSVDGDDANQLEPTWCLDNGVWQFQIPVRVVNTIVRLHVTSQPSCPLLQEGDEAQWLDELAGVLSTQTAYFLLAELPGLAQQSRWACSLESAIFDAVSRLPVIRQHDAAAKASGVSEWLSAPQSAISVDARLDLIQMNPVQTVGLLWMSALPDGSEHRNARYRIEDRPYAYRGFSIAALNLRGQVLEICKEGRFSSKTQSALTSCVPWQDWRNNEGVVLYWFGFQRDGWDDGEERVRTLIHELEIRMQASLRAYFCRRDVTNLTRPAELLRMATAMMEASYPDFLHVLSQQKPVQFEENGTDVVDRILPEPIADSSYHHALQLLKPLIEDKGGQPLLEALESYLECGAKMQTTAEKLYLHRNTLRYRLKRAEKLLQISLDDDEVRFTYQVAIRTWRLRNPKLPS